jgi:hypothetical protein
MRTVVGALAALVGPAFAGYVAGTRIPSSAVAVFRPAARAPEAHLARERSGVRDAVPDSGSGRFVVAAGGR